MAHDLINLQKPTPYPSIPEIRGVDPSLARILEPIKQAIEMGLGRRGDPLEQFPTLRSLYEMGSLKLVLNGRTHYSTPAGNAPYQDYTAGSATDPQNDLSIPPAPTSFTVSAALATMILSWTIPAYSGNSRHAHTEIWRSDTDNLGSAAMIGTTDATLYADAVGYTGAAKYYWLRFVSVADVKGPYNAVGGTLATTGKVGNVDLTDLIVTAGKIADGAVIGTKVADGAIGSPKIAGGAVGTTQLADAAITTTKLANLAVDNTKLAALAVDAAKLADGAVTTGKLANLAVDNTKLAELAVDAAKLADSAVTSTKIANAAVGSAAIANAAIGTAHIANAAVGSAAIANAAIGTAHIADAAITNAKIERWILGKSGTAFPLDANVVDGEIFYRTDVNVSYRASKPAGVVTWIAVDYVESGGRLADGIITSAKIGNAAVGSAQIADAAIIEAKIGTAAVGSAAIQNAAITNAAIANLAVDSAKIADGAIVTAKIGDAQITNAKVVNLDAAKLTSGFIDAGRINALQVALSSTGFVRGGQTAYNTGAGFWLGYDTAAYKFSIGDSAGQNLRWDGTNLVINGGGTFSGNLSAAGGTFAGSLSAATGTFSGTLTASAVDAIDTINIAGNAVTIPVSASAHGASSLQVSINCTGRPVFVSAFMGVGLWDGAGIGPASLQLSRNGSVVSTVEIPIPNKTSGSDQAEYRRTGGSISWSDTPPAGTHTYTISVSANVAVEYYYSSIYAVETKR